MMIAIFLVIGVILSTTASFVFGIPWLMPILGAAVPYPIFFLEVRRQQYKSAFWWMLLWGVLQSIAVIVATGITPETAAKVIHRGQSYTTEMLHWIRTGEGSEGILSLFLPNHLLHYAIFCLLCVVTLSSAACGYRCQSSSSAYLAKTTVVCVGLNSFVCQNFIVGLDCLLCDRIPAKIFQCIFLSV
ncbi:MAG: hypothetical protein KME50_03950 [Nostoc desertorum CM1-VF14]|jgi:uncharacterized RDD family membrane protein YckC|nr:hypothetical protein [Nostoc desertorum CM1-VF14]